MKRRRGGRPHPGPPGAVAPPNPEAAREHPKLRLTVPWESIDLSAQNQIRNVLALPQLVRLAIMPDVHAGYDLPVGGVALLQDAVSPSFVGFDIGCGMCHVNLGMTAKELGLDKQKDRERFFSRLRSRVPAGPSGKGAMPTDMTFKSACNDKDLDKCVNQAIHEQSGSLGSGNHFLELGENAQGHVAITIHSGSRRAGYEIAFWYMARGSGSPIPTTGDLGKA
ncbi:MAG: RtcB family protein [Desulfovibrio sp.]|nr:RtcB family protein [Desulfovibrio sp.]